MMMMMMKCAVSASVVFAAHDVTQEVDDDDCDQQQYHAAWHDTQSITAKSTFEFTPAQPKHHHMNLCLFVQLILHYHLFRRVALFFASRSVQFSYQTL